MSWASIIDDNSIAQVEALSRMPFIEGHVALMPDAHLGKGATIGSVIPTRGAIIPAAVGVDLGCGMSAWKLDLLLEQLPDDLKPILDEFERVIPSGIGKGHRDLDFAGAVLKIMSAVTPSTDIVREREGKLFETTCQQLGSLGSGNHFFELSVDSDNFVWLVLHSGSRGVGNQLARKHIDAAKGLMKKYFINLEDADLAYLVQGTREFDDYIKDLRFAQAYARENRRIMMTRALRAVGRILDITIPTLHEIDCHHNYTAMEHHWGKNIWITRKGAVSAREGEYGILPGNMGTHTFIVKGLGNAASFMSAPHGAGRMMSRTKAKEMFEVDGFKDAMLGKVWLEGKAEQLLDEHPGSYKPIGTVLRDSADLVEVVTELTQLVNYKGL